MTQPKISSIAYLIAEPVRAVILITLSDGGSLSASALADAAGVRHGLHRGIAQEKIMGRVEGHRVGDAVGVDDLDAADRA